MDFPLQVASFPGTIFSHACWQSGDEAAAIFAAAAAVQLLGCERTQHSDVKRTPDELALVKLVKDSRAQRWPVDGQIRRPVPTWSCGTLDELANWWRELSGADLWRNTM